MKHLKTAASLIIFLFLLAQSSHAQTYADIRFSCKQCVGQELQIELFTLITSKTQVLFQEQIGDSGVVRTKVPIDFGRLIWLGVKENEIVKRESFYIEPGNTLEVSLTDSTWSAMGVPGQVYQHLSRIRQVDKERNEVFRGSYNYSEELDSLKIQAAFRQLSAYREEIDKEIESDNLLPQKFKNLLFAANSAPLKGFELFLDTRKVLFRQSQNQENAASLADLPGHLIDKNMLLISYRYSFPLTTDLSARFREILSRYDAGNPEKGRNIYRYLKGKIGENPGFTVFPDYFLAYGLYNVTALTKMSFYELRDMFNSFRADYPDSPFHQEFEPVLKEYAALKPGSPALDFEMISPEGTSIKLSDFRGKLVYIDLWATWCVPCREEFKYSEKLSDRYADRDDLAFMYVSMDSNLDDWRKFLSDNPSLDGVHGLQQAPRSGDKPDPEKEKKMVFHLYKARGVPHYILIDKAGNIIDYDAPRPSRLLKSGYLDQLLKP